MLLNSEMVEMPSNSKNIPGLYIKHESNEGSWVRGSTSTNYSKNDLDYHRKLAFHGKENDILKKNEGIIPRYAGKLWCVERMVVDSILPHAEFGANDHREDAPHFKR